MVPSRKYSKYLRRYLSILSRALCLFPLRALQSKYFYIPFIEQRSQNSFKNYRIRYHFTLIKYGKSAVNSEKGPILSQYNNFSCYKTVPFYFLENSSMLNGYEF